jgi:hypothetical protein
MLNPCPSFLCSCQATRRLPARARTAITETQEPTSKPSSTSTNPSSSVGGVAALRKRTALGDMTNAGSRRVLGGAATSEGIQSSGKDLSSGAVSKGKLALRDSNVTTTGASRGGVKNVNGKPSAVTTTTAVVRASNKQQASAEGDRPVRVSKRATAVTTIPSRSKSASTASTASRSNSVQSTASQKTASSKEAASFKTASAKDDRGVKRLKTDRGEKRVAAGYKDGELVHKKATVIQEEVKEVTPAKDEGWEDLDAEDADDPLMVAEYVNEIFDYMKELEVSLAISVTDCPSSSSSHPLSTLISSSFSRWITFPVVTTLTSILTSIGRCEVCSSIGSLTFTANSVYFLRHSFWLKTLLTDS